jgi:hypothetical protein
MVVVLAPGGNRNVDVAVSNVSMWARYAPSWRSPRNFVAPS